MFDVASADEDFCYLTTRGRVSGQPHEIEIWFAADGETLYMLAGQVITQTGCGTCAPNRPSGFVSETPRTTAPHA